MERNCGNCKHQAICKHIGAYRDLIKDSFANPLNLAEFCRFFDKD